MNYRIPDILCALGRSQLKKLDRFVQRRRELVARYRTALSNVEGIDVGGAEAEGVQAAWHLFAIQFRQGRVVRDAVHLALRKLGIGTQVHYIGVNSFPWYREMGFDPGATPIAAAVSERILSLPLFPAMSDDDVDRVVDAVRSVMRAL